MEFHADLHIHSKYSRATSRDLDLEHLAWWAARKGIAVVGTGDCVHPAWLAEMKDKLVPAGATGLFQLKPEIEAALWKTLPAACRTPVRFMLSTEISTIYKKGERTRKIHHLVYVPDFAAADRLASSLARIGNIASDGRPILGLDSRNLLEVTLQSSPDAYLVPAHIWTPWFAALGSQSGFDSIHECYGDLCDHVFAVETGLSSDPAMNWRVSSLDRYRLISNSDAHSPGKLGREATRYSCAADFFAIRRALETGEGYVGTVEFFPEEGKYHLDGHRACGVRFDPAETLAHEGRCPVCGNRVTVGVAHRVEALADRKEADARPPTTAGAVTSLVPLPEILSEIVGGGVASQGVTRAYDRTTAALGSDFTVLEDTPVEDIDKVHPLLGEAVNRLRAGKVIRQAGYDGQYGVIRLFEDGELDRLTRGELLFDAPLQRRPRAKAKAAPAAASPREQAAPPTAAPAPSKRRGVLAALDEDQARAAETVDGPLVVVAGPGSGKTRMIAHRIAHLVLERGVPAASCLAITFTRRAAEELRGRLAALLPDDAEHCPVHTFHSLGLAFLRAEAAAAGLAPDFRVADERERTAALTAELGITESRAARLLKSVSMVKRTGEKPADEEIVAALAACRRLGLARNWVDFDDLVCLPVEVLEAHADIAARWRERFSQVCVDEFQDVDNRQYGLLRLLVPPAGNVCAIGDPDQAIYGFRGANAVCFTQFGQDFPTARTVRLQRNYRSTGSIVTAAAQVIGNDAPTMLMRPMQAPLTLYAAPTEHAEAEFVAATIEHLLGGHDLLAAGDARTRQSGDRPLGFADFAVLYRSDAQSAALRVAFDRAGIPFAKSSPAPLAGQSAVRALLAVLAAQSAELRERDLSARIVAAVDHLRQEEPEPDVAALDEAKRWLTALAASGNEAGDEARLREQVALSTEADFWDARADRVSLLTMHAAKGLEFPVVFVVGLEDGLVPWSWGTVDDAADARAPDAEERRLFYVAMTRAKDLLILSRAIERHWRGERRRLPPSPFLGDIASDLLQQQTAPAREQRAEQRQFKLF